MRIANCLRAITFVVSTFALVPNSWALTELYYTSSPESWVGHGETVAITPGMGFDFNASGRSFNGISFYINNFSAIPDPALWSVWILDFDAPFQTPLTVGTYLNATRYPFNDNGTPGLSFAGNGRGDNQLTGQFTVLEARYSPEGVVQNFAADFVQYDEGNLNWWNKGSIRFNSDIPIGSIGPVPEPQSALMTACGLGLVAAYARRRKASK